jgi:hypothetical protein
MHQQPRQLYLANTMYASENKGRYFPAAPYLYGDTAGLSVGMVRVNARIRIANLTRHQGHWRNIYPTTVSRNARSY